jgi:GrpB-like predicted nucleotidyltransferase (UPF0157 family)
MGTTASSDKKSYLAPSETLGEDEGLPSSVIIANYDPRWPILYEEEKILILGVVGHKLIAIEHIGSTAVPDLGAKPIIDMMAGVRTPSEADECLLPLGGIGYTSFTPQPDDTDHYYCLGKGPHSVGYHLHLIRFGSDSWKRPLLFRDYLRAHHDVAQQYHETKRSLAAEYASNRAAYTGAKTSFIKATLARAREACP